MTTTDYGPQAPQIEALITRIGVLTTDEAVRLVAALDDARNARYAARNALDAALDAALDDDWHAAWYAARDAAWGAARGAALDDLDATLDAAWCAAWYAAWDTSRRAARDAALALVVRDLIPTDDYDTLTTPWRQVVGPIHPDDPDL